MSALTFLGVVLGGFNAILLGVVIFILKQPDPHKGREAAEIHELGERITELSKHFLTFEKKFEKQITETSGQNLAKLDRFSKDMGQQLKDIHDSL
ncbi:MAG: hypothetical protein QNK37_12340 [Acidobacteriota bacterium]|nr:hypothetical protein [Acidobacteriota bacterium]